MAYIRSGTFIIGSNQHYPEEASAHKVLVNSFWIDRHTVTNAEFQRFFDATGHVTTAERPVNPEEYSGALPDMLAPFSVMFARLQKRADLRNRYKPVDLYARRGLASPTRPR